MRRAYDTNGTEEAQGRSILVMSLRRPRVDRDRTSMGVKSRRVDAVGLSSRHHTSTGPCRTDDSVERRTSDSGGGKTDHSCTAYIYMRVSACVICRFGRRQACAWSGRHRVC